MRGKDAPTNAGVGNVTPQIVSSLSLQVAYLADFGLVPSASANLRAILHQTQGHKSTCNAPYVDPFVRWLRTAAPNVGQVYGWPDSVFDWDRSSGCSACAIRRDDDSFDRECMDD
jgi:hypothetical protein